MKKADKLAWDKWENEHILISVFFYWKNKDGVDEDVVLRNTTYNGALRVAKEKGYQEPCWYKPRTWFAGVVTLG